MSPVALIKFSLGCYGGQGKFVYSLKILFDIEDSPCQTQF